MLSEQCPPSGSPGPSPHSHRQPLEDKHSRIRVLLVDDHALLRQSLRNIVDDDEGLEVVGEASDGLEAIHAVRLLRPDVVVMDINMPKMNGIEATKLIKDEFPHTSVIGLSVEQGMDMVQRMQAAGIHSYLAKESAVDALCQAIEEAVARK